MTVPEISLDDLDRRHHEALAAVRAVQPVAWLDALGGWVVTARDLAVQVMRDAERFTVDDPRFSTAQVVGPSMLSLDGAEHQRHRTPFAEPLRPADANAQYAARIERLADERVAALAPLGTAELRRALAGPLAVDVSAMVLGLDGIGTQALLATYDRIVGAVDDVSRGLPVSEEGSAAFAQLGSAVRDQLHGDSLVAHAARDLDVDETVSNAAVFLFGGIETSEGMTANLLHHVLSSPSDLAAVTADPSLVDAALEESLRLEPAAARVDRYATVDVEMAGARIRRGDLVVVSLAAANRDPAVYEQPDRFVLRRDNARTHVAFAVGPHACIGAQLARLQARAALRSVVRRLVDVRLDAQVEVRGVIFRKPVALHATWRRT